MGTCYSRLSPDERIRIERLHCEQGLSVRETAGLIGRDKATVSRELKRGPWFASNKNESYRPYRPRRLKTGPWTSMPFHSALTAQRRADLRRHESRKPHRMDSDRLRSWVMDALRRGWSPELIEGRLKLEHPGRPGDARQPRVPPPMDLRETAARPGPAPIPAAGQEAPRQTEGTQGQGAAHPDARAHLAAAEDGSLARAVRPLGVGHRDRRGPLARVHRHAGRTQKPQTVRPPGPQQERHGHRARRIRDPQGPAAPGRGSTGPGTTAARPPATSWSTRPWACPPTSPTPTCFCSIVC